MPRYSIIGVKDAKFLIVDSAAIVEQDVLWINQATFENNTQEITFEGDDQADRRFFLNSVRVTLTFEKFDLEALVAAYGKTWVTAGLPTGELYRVYFGDAQEVAGVTCGLALTVDARDEDTGVLRELYPTFPVGKLNLFTPQSPQYNNKWGKQLVFEASKSAVDLLDVALPGVPSGGAFWYLAAQKIGSETFTPPT